MASKRLGNAKKWHSPEKLGDGLPEWVSKNVEKPARALEDILPVWKSMVPENVAQACRLTLSRGVLRVSVTSAAGRAYLDMILKGGVAAAIKKQFPAKVHAIRTSVKGGFSNE